MKKQLFFVSTLCVLAFGFLLVSCSKKEDVSQLPSSCFCVINIAGYPSESYEFTRRDMKEMLEYYDMKAGSCSQFAKVVKMDLEDDGERASVTCENGD